MVQLPSPCCSNVHWDEVRIRSTVRWRSHSRPYLLVISFVEMEADERPIVFAGNVRSSACLLVDNNIGTS